MSDSHATTAKSRRKSAAVPSIEYHAKSLDRMAKVAEKLYTPLWTLLIPGLDKHPELLQVGALKPLQTVVENYLRCSADRRGAIELAAAVH